MKNNTTIAKPKTQNKASLHSILYYDPAWENSQKPAEPSFDALGYIKSLILVIVGQVQPDLMSITEKSVVEQGISSGLIKIPELPPIKVYYQNKPNSEQKLLEYSSKLQQPKSYILFITPTPSTHQTPLTQTLLHINQILKTFQPQSQPLSPSPSPSASILYYSTSPKKRSQQQLSQLFEIAVKNNYLFLQIPVLCSIVEGIKQICIFKAVQFKSQPVYIRQCQWFKMHIQKLKVQIVQIGKLEGTGFMEVKKIWGDKVDGVYKQVVRLIGQFKDLLQVIKENQQNIQQLADIQKQMVKIRELEQVREYLMELNEAEKQIDRQSMMISNNTTPTNISTNLKKLTTLISTLTNTISTHKQKSDLTKARKHKLTIQAQQEIQDLLLKHEEIKTMLSDFKNIDEYKSQNQNQSKKQNQNQSSSLYNIQNYRANYYEVEEKELKIEMEEEMGDVQRLVDGVGDVWAWLGKEARYGDANMRLIQQENCQGNKQSEQDVISYDPVMIMATYYIQHRLQTYEAQPQNNLQKPQPQKPTLNPLNQPSQQQQYQQNTDTILSISNRISIQDAIKQEKLSNSQKIINKIKLLQQKILKYQIYKVNQLLKTKQCIQYQFDIFMYGFGLLEKLWMKVNKGKVEFKETKIKRQNKYDI